MNILSVFSVYSLLLALLAGESSHPILIESLESKTDTGKIVYNKISLEEKKDLDIWTMDQSHHGLEAKSWDKIQIKVYKNSKPFKVSYHQLQDGKEVEYKTSCIRCHSNGPRFIRHNFASKKVSLSDREKLTLKSWNYKIKSYGEVEIKNNNPFKRVIALKDQNAHKTLDIKSCKSCHFAGGPRGELTSEQKGTIQFLVKNKQMPPWPYEISKEDKVKLNEFIYNF